MSTTHFAQGTRSLKLCVSRRKRSSSTSTFAHLMTWICGKKARRHEERSQSARMIGPTRTPKLAEEASKKADEFDRLVGDGLRIKKNVNKDSLWVRGDGCRITFATNNGRLRVSGDGCRVNIGCNLGTVEYTGDGGHIILGPESRESDGVVYKGDGGVIDFAGKRKHVCKSENKETATTTTTTSHGAGHIRGKGDMRTKIVGSNNVQIHFNLRVSDKHS